VAEPQEGYLDKAFEEAARVGRTRVQYGNQDTPSRDDPRLQSLVAELLARVEALEQRVDALEEEAHDAAPG
jgi:alkylation response protein AidB-like acyl-CoA dehydrogenase